MNRLENALYAVQEAVHSLAEAAFADDKTPLLNAFAFRKHAPSALADVERPIVLVFGDINQFKAVNEQHGHFAGDAAINRVGELLHEIAIACDARAYRQSGDEFVILLPEGVIEEFCTAAKDKLAIAKVTYVNQTFDVGVSFGYVHPDGSNPHELMKKAEEACITAKGESGSVAKWTPAVASQGPTHIRHRCTNCQTKFDCWIPTREQDQLWCPGCGNAIKRNQ